MDSKFIIPLFILISSLTVSTQQQFLHGRQLADFFIGKKLKSAPQDPKCSCWVNITSVRYQMLSFDTREMQMTSLVKLNMMWKDPDITWNNTISTASAILLPVDKIWTPGFIFDNAIDVTVKPYSNDVQVTSDGIVDFAVVLFIVVSCEINLFTYPFVSGDCLVAINGLTQSECTLQFYIENKNVYLDSNNDGEWTTERVSIRLNENKRNRRYLLISLSINAFGAIVTLILPSVLIMVTDLVSFALPVHKGERNNLKVTLVLSITMFLLILNEHLPSGGTCSPILHYHFCFCLVTLVLSMVISIVLTRLASEDFILKKTQRYGSRHSLEQENDTDVGEPQSVWVPSEMSSIKKIVNYLEDVDQEHKNSTRKETSVDRLDKKFFCVFVSIYIIYIIILCAVVSNANICKPEQEIFWDNENGANITNQAFSTTTNATGNATDNSYSHVFYEWLYYSSDYSDDIQD